MSWQRQGKKTTKILPRRVAVYKGFSLSATINSTTAAALTFHHKVSYIYLFSHTVAFHWFSYKRTKKKSYDEQWNASYSIQYVNIGVCIIFFCNNTNCIRFSNKKIYEKIHARCLYIVLRIENIYSKMRCSIFYITINVCTVYIVFDYIFITIFPP